MPFSLTNRREWGLGADAAIGFWRLSYYCKLKKSTCCVKILCTLDCSLSPVAIAVVPGSCDVGPHVDAVPNWDAVPHSDVEPHVDAVSNWEMAPHSDVAWHDDVAQKNLSGLSFMTVPPLLCAELLRGFGSLRSIVDSRFGWRRWKAATGSLAFFKFSTGSHVLSSGPYPFQLTKYCSLFLHTLESSTVSTSYSSSLFMISGGGMASCSLPSILFAR